MTHSDDDHIAPVINLFGDRTASAQSEETAVESSSEGVPAGESWADEAPNEPAPDSGTGTPLARVASIAPARSLPTMSDFAPSHNNNDAITADRAGTSAIPTDAPEGPHEQAAGSSRAARREARDGFSEISRVSMRALARRGMSSHEMTQFLGTREFEAEEIEAEIERLESSALLDDAALAETLTRTLRERKGLGAAAITAELRRRKIDQEHIHAVVDCERDEEQERANELAFKRAPQLRSLDSVTAKRRLSGFLMRKGYSGSVVSAAVNAALAGGGSGTSGGPSFR